MQPLLVFGPGAARNNGFPFLHKLVYKRYGLKIAGYSQYTVKARIAGDGTMVHTKLFQESIRGFILNKQPGKKVQQSQLKLAVPLKKNLILPE
jgi:hypothetical protein